MTYSKPENQHNLKHGGEGAIKRLTSGEPFLGMALDQQHEVENRLATEGLDAIVETNAIRLQTTTDLFYAAILKAAQVGDIELFERYVARYGWIAGVTLRAWAQVKHDQKQNGGKLAEVLDAYNNQPQDTPESPQDEPGEAQ